MKRIILFAVIAIGATACSRNTITGRNQLSLVSDEQVQAMALVQYKEFLNTNTVIPSGSQEEMVKRVGNRIAVAITQYYKDHGNPEALNGYNWEFNLIQNKEVNAWCMPGGKVVVYTGILPVTQTEAALAIVMGHEITHAVAGHGKERLSQQLLAQGIEVAGDIALSRDPKAVNVFNQIYAPSAQLGVLLPNSRKQEFEADHYGLIFAAMAGYDPREAIPFWTRMASLGGDNKPPVFLSDHPADADRIAQMQSLMPEALKYYKGRR